ncbi:MAG: CoA transferase [Gemmataceae bacterium]
MPEPSQDRFRRISCLQGVRVLELARVLAGPLCGQLLADLGAEVIKIERPGLGDETRTWGPPFADSLSAYFLSCNRNKRSLALDLSQPQGLAVLDQLVQRADVVVTNFLPATAERLGISAARLHRINPRLIVCSLTGFGWDTSWRDKPGYDFAIQALAGMMSITGPVEGPPSKVGVAIADVVAALYAAVTVLACIHARLHSGLGYAIDLSLLDATVAAQVNVVQAYLVTGQVPPRQGNAHLQIVPYQLFATRDGYLVLAIGNDGQWQRFCRVCGQEAWAHDPRFATNPQRVRHRQDLVTLLEPLLRSRTTAQWQELLDAAEVPCAPVLDYQQLFALPVVQERAIRMTVTDAGGQPVDLVAPPFRIRASDGQGVEADPHRCPPALGADTLAILRQVLGYSDEQLAELARAGVIA